MSLFIRHTGTILNSNDFNEPKLANQNGSICTSVAKDQIKFELRLCTKQLIPKVA